MSVMFSSCNTDEDIAYCAIGDSLIARWDIQSDFPSHQIYNMGVSGSGIDYLESKQNSCKGRIVFVLSGTNDLSKIRNNINAYSDRYFNAIEGLGGERTYIISLLPRNFDSDDNDYNELIKTFNKLIIEQAKNYPTINVLDVHDSFTKDGTMNEQLSYDGLHLNNYGYEVLSSILRKYIK